MLRFDKKANRGSSSNDPDCKICFVQWYKSLSTDTLTIDNIDQVLKCAPLRWKRVLGEKNALLTSKELELLQLESIRYVVIVPKDPFLDFVAKNNIEKLSSEH